MIYECLKFFSCLNIPQTNGLVSTPTCQRLTVGTKRYTMNPICMTCECLKFFSCLNIPQTNGLVPTPTCQRLTVRTKRYTVDCPCMTNKFPEFFPCGNIPQTDTTIPTSACQCTTIRTKGYTKYLPSMPYEQITFFTGLCIVKPNTDTTRNRQKCIIRRILKSVYISLTKPGFRTFRQTPCCPISWESLLFFHDLMFSCFLFGILPWMLRAV